jgi:hypothetical protein
VPVDVWHMNSIYIFEYLIIQARCSYKSFSTCIISEPTPFDQFYIWIEYLIIEARCSTYHCITIVTFDSFFQLIGPTILIPWFWILIPRVLDTIRASIVSRKATKELYDHQQIKKKNDNLEIRICSLSQNIYVMLGLYSKEEVRLEV